MRAADRRLSRFVLVILTFHSWVFLCLRPRSPAPGNTNTSRSRSIKTRCEQSFLLQHRQSLLKNDAIDEIKSKETDFLTLKAKSKGGKEQECQWTRTTNGNNAKNATLLLVLHAVFAHLLKKFLVASSMWNLVWRRTFSGFASCSRLTRCDLPRQLLQCHQKLLLKMICDNDRQMRWFQQLCLKLKGESIEVYEHFTSWWWFEMGKTTNSFNWKVCFRGLFANDVINSVRYAKVKAMSHFLMWLIPFSW